MGDNERIKKFAEKMGFELREIPELVEKRGADELHIRLFDLATPKEIEAFLMGVECEREKRAPGIAHLGVDDCARAIACLLEKSPEFREQQIKKIIPILQNHWQLSNADASYTAYEILRMLFGLSVLKPADHRTNQEDRA